MAFCNNCGAQLDEGKNFCTKCGTKVGGAPEVRLPKPNRKVLFAVAAAVIAAVAAVVVVRGIFEASPENLNVNSLTITGITGLTGEALVWVASDLSDFDGHLVAMGKGAIKSGKLSITLKQMIYDNFRTEQELFDWTGTGQDWTGNGSFYVAIIFIDDMQVYSYTNGNQSEERFDFDGASKSLEFTKFVRTE